MGGYNSGKKSPDQLKPIVEDFININVLEFKKSGLLDAGMDFIMDYTANGIELASVSITVAEDALALEYKFNQRRHNQEVALFRTPCNYGSLRAWLLCPKCQAKRTSLYLSAEGFWACRVCLGLAYRSNRLNPHSRFQYRAEKIKRKKLPITPGTFTSASVRPFGMSRKRHIRILDEALKNEKKSHELFMFWFEEIKSKTEEKDRQSKCAYHNKY